MVTNCNSFCFKRLMELYIHEQTHGRTRFTQYYSFDVADVLFSIRLQRCFKPNAILCTPLLLMDGFSNFLKSLYRNLQLNEDIQLT